MKGILMFTSKHAFKILNFNGTYSLATDNVLQSA